jgi:HAMP domain-containing protein
MSSKGTKFGDKLLLQRKSTDERIRKLGELGGDRAKTLPIEIRGHLEKAESSLAELATKREAASSLAVAPKEIIDYYTGLNKQLLSSIGSIASRSSNAELGRLSVAYLAFLHAKEKTGIERAQLSNVFGTNQFALGQFSTVAGLISAQESYLEVFASLVNPEILTLYRERMAAPAVAEVARMEQVARDRAATGDFGIQSTDWFATMTEKIDLLKAVEDALSATVVNRANAVMDDANRSLRTTVMALVALFVVVLGAALILARSIVRPVRQLTEIADKVSMGDLQQQVAVSASGEIGDLASSFSRMVNAFKVMDAMLSEDAVAGDSRGP